MTNKDTAGTKGITVERATRELQVLCEDAENFLTSEMEDEWELAERYYRGETDLETVENRSNVVKTEVRDAIRNSMPSIMRVLLQSRKIVEYIPTSVQHAQWVEQQSEYVTSLFFQCGGYMQLYNSILEALKLKIGPMKVWWEPEPSKEFMEYTNVPFTFIEEMKNNPLFTIEDFEKNDSPIGEPNMPDTYTLTGYRNHENGRIHIQSIPNYEFFISRNVNSIDQALAQGVHGHRTVCTVQEAEQLGLTSDDWTKYDVEDPEQSDHTSSSTVRRGYNKQDVNDPGSVDLTTHKFLLTEAYVRYDLKGTGSQQTYKFYLGGTGHQYIHHEEVEDSPFAIITPIPIPHTVYGHSLAELVIKEQDTSTSMLRATVDNAHAANNSRVFADPAKTNFDDLMNPALNAPVRSRNGAQVQVVQVPFTGQGSLGLLQYLDNDVQQKVGITKAAQGLDPDALQSTDKNAVMNTIATSQGQTELMVRNIVETGLIRVFSMMLRLSAQHMNPIQTMMVKGKFIPVNASMFDPNAIAVPNVGLGTASPEQKQAALSFVYAEQQKYMQMLGPNNPFTSYSAMYNTLEDLVEAAGLYNVSRYFNIVTPQVEKQWGEQQQKAAAMQAQQAQENAPMDPSKAFLEVEQLKAQLKKAEFTAEAAYKAETLRLDALKTAGAQDIQRDKLVQDRVIKLAELQAAALNEQIKAEQKTNDQSSPQNTTSSKQTAKQ